MSSVYTILKCHDPGIQYERLDFAPKIELCDRTFYSPNARGLQSPKPSSEVCSANALAPHAVLALLAFFPCAVPLFSCKLLKLTLAWRNAFVLLGEAVQNGWIPVVQVAGEVLVEDKR